MAELEERGSMEFIEMQYRPIIAFLEENDLSEFMLVEFL